MLQNADRKEDFFRLAFCTSQCTQVRGEQIKTFFASLTSLLSTCATMQQLSKFENRTYCSL